MGNSGGATTSSKGKRNNVSRIQLPAWYEGDLATFQGNARDLYGRYLGRGYPSMYTGLDPATVRGLGMVEGTAGAAGGSMVPQEALAEWQKTVRGDYGNPDSNRWLREVADRAGLETEGRVNAQYATGGASGGGAYANALADSLTEQRANLYADNYQQERQRQLAALGMAPMAENLQYADAARLGMVGQRREEDALAKAAEANRQYMADWDALGRYQDALFGNPAQRAVTVTEKGTSSESTNQSNKFDWASFVGGLLG